MVSRRKFVKQGALFVPAVFGILSPRANGQSFLAHRRTASRPKPGGGGGAITRIQGTTKDTASSTNDTLAFTSNLGTGNLCLAVCRLGAGAGTITISSPDLTWAKVRGHDVPSGEHHELWYSMNSVAGAETVTLNWSGAATTMRWAIAEYSGILTSGALDQQNSAASAGTANPASGSITPTTNNQLLFCTVVMSTGQNATAGTDFTLQSTVASPHKLATEDYVQATAAAHDGTFTLGGSDQESCIIASFKGF